MTPRNPTSCARAPWRPLLLSLVLLLSIRPVNSYSEVEKGAVAPEGETCLSDAPVPLENDRADVSNYSKAEKATGKEECNEDAGDHDRTLEIIDTGVEQTVSGDRSHEVLDLIERTEEYMRKHVMVEPMYDSVRNNCKNQHDLCSFWSVIGECEANPAYMILNCAPACKTCEKLDIRVRCPMDPNAKDVLNAGDLNRMFERIINNPEYRKYKPTVVSRPDRSDENESKETDASRTDGLWLVTLEEFLSSEEADRLIELASIEGYERSTDVGSKRFDGSYGNYTSTKRTSENAWCQHECFRDETTRRVLERIEDLTGIPDGNSEYLQLLRYTEGQFYGVHNDFIPHQVERQPGPRILTFYMYLNDVEEGGGTNFPELGKTVTPKKGKAVLWPSVLDEDPNVPDSRSDHQALPVVKGVKHGANAWIHLRDYKQPNGISCS